MLRIYEGKSNQFDTACTSCLLVTQIENTMTKFMEASFWGKRALNFTKKGFFFFIKVACLLGFRPIPAVMLISKCLSKPKLSMYGISFCQNLQHYMCRRFSSARPSISIRHNRDTFVLFTFTQSRFNARSRNHGNAQWAREEPVRQNSFLVIYFSSILFLTSWTVIHWGIPQ